MNPYDYYQEISQDSFWNRLLDSLVILVVGFSAGMILMQYLMFQELNTPVTTTEIIQQVPTVPQVESGVEINSDSGIKVEES